MYLVLSNVQGTGAPSSWSGTVTQNKMLASDGAGSDLFGRSVSVSSAGNTALVGAYGDSSNTGAAYVFTQSGGVWTEQQKLIASDGAGGDQFAIAVSISGDGNTAIVGAQGEDDGGADAGAAYVFTQSGGVWTQQQKLTASDAQASDQFGQSVSISEDGNTAIVGAPSEDGGGSTAGAAYVFTRSGGVWTQQQKLLAGDAQSNDSFGFPVSISSDGNAVIVGAAYEDANGSNAGAAYVFTQSGGVWTQQQKLLASDGEANDYFGLSAAINSDGTVAIVGAFGEDEVAGSAGAAYIFTQSGGVWTQQQKLLASDAQANAFLGYSSAISPDGSTAIAGAILDPENGSSSGAAYIFTQSGGVWTQQQKLTASDGESGDNLGIGVSLSSDGTTAIVGAHQEDTNGSNAGAAYTFSI